MPDRQTELKTLKVGDISIEKCPRCEGTWYSRNELRILKDRISHGDYSWIEFDLWKDAKRFRSEEQRGCACPQDGSQMITANYEHSDIAIDVCPRCHGVWLDKGEFEHIVDYLDAEVNRSSAGDFAEDLRDEFAELIRAEEDPGAFVRQTSKILYFLQLRFVLDHPGVRRILAAWPKF